MKRTLLIATVLFSFACSHSAQQSQNDTTTAAAASRPSEGGVGAATGGPTGTTAANTAVERVTLVGCLQGPALPGATGTAGSASADRARARSSGGAAADEQTHGAASSARYTLVDAAIESGGTGANGAGGSGGPLLSPGTSVDLDGVPADAQNSVNKQVRVTGTIDARPGGAASAANATVGGETPGAASGTSGSGVAAEGTGGAASSGGSARSSGPGSTSGGGMSTRDDVRANSTTAASGATQSGSGARHVTVETVQVVAQSCAGGRR
jgi:hypothetical protein